LIQALGDFRNYTNFIGEITYKKGTREEKFDCIGSHAFPTTRGEGLKSSCDLSLHHVTVFWCSTYYSAAITKISYDRLGSKNNAAKKLGSAMYTHFIGAIF
jgi:hypothetical protein